MSETSESKGAAGPAQSASPVTQAPNDLAVVVGKSKRWGFIDQFRGIVIFLFVMADITWTWSGDIDADTPRLPTGPTWLNHGWKFYDFTPKQLITLIDVGQLLFVFVMGLMLPLSWKRHAERGGVKGALGQLLVRLGWFYLIALVMALDFDTGEISWVSMFFRGTFAVLAAAMVGATVVNALVKDPDHRQYVNIGLMVLLTVLYAIPAIRTWENAIFGVDEEIELIPLNLLGATITAIQGGITMEWFANAEDKKQVFKDRILPVAMFSLIACFLVDIFFWADHHAMNTAMVTMSYGCGMFLFMVFYVLEADFEFSVPGLKQFGRNTLLAFILALPFQMIVWDLLDIDQFKTADPNTIAPLMFLLSAVLMYFLYYIILVPLDRKDWYFTPSVFIRLFQARQGTGGKHARPTPRAAEPEPA